VILTITKKNESKIHAMDMKLFISTGGKREAFTNDIFREVCI
jgi:hypothetical protein